MQVRTREHSPKETLWIHKKNSLPKVSINPLFLALCVILVPLIMGIFIINPLFALWCLLICCIIFPFINKKPISVKYKTLPSAELNENTIHHNKFCTFWAYHKEIIQKNIFHNEYQSIFISSLLKILLYTFLILHLFVVFILILTWSYFEIWTLWMLYIILTIVWLCLLWWFFHIHKKYKFLKNKIYSPNNNFLFLVSPKEKYYYEVLENENGGNDYIIY